MAQIGIKRVYDPYSSSDGYRVLVDRLWPRGIRKDELHYDLWPKDITPSNELRQWYHEDMENRWPEFKHRYMQELEQHPGAVTDFVDQVKDKEVVTLLYGAKDTVTNHAVVLRDYLEKHIR